MVVWAWLLLLLSHMTSFQLPNGPSHVRQHSSPDAFYRPSGGSFKKVPFNKSSSKKHSLEDMTGMKKSPYSGLPPASPATTRKILLEVQRLPCFLGVVDVLFAPLYICPLLSTPQRGFSGTIFTKVQYQIILASAITKVNNYTNDS